MRPLASESMATLRHCPAPAKLNLYLHVLGRRDDGYHDIDTVFDLIDLQDTMSFSARDDGAIMRRGNVHGLAHDNDLSVRAARLLAAASETRLGVDIDIVKRIPVGGGLGGGSSNAATTLLALNRLWGVNWPVARLARLSLQLGADVPVFVHGTAAHASGVGDKLTPLTMPPQWYVLVAPPALVPTPEIFGAPELTRDTKPLKISRFSRSLIGAHGRNDLEPVASGRYPAVEKALLALNQAARQVLGRTGPGKKAAAGKKGAALNGQREGPGAGPKSGPRAGPKEVPDPGAGAAPDAGAKPGAGGAGSAQGNEVDSRSCSWEAARMSGSGACVFLPVATQDEATRIRDIVAASEVGAVHVVRSVARHPLRTWAFVRP